MDFNGDESVDLIDAQDHTTGVSWNDGSFSHWKVYLNTNITAGVEEMTDGIAFNVYPNPTHDFINITSDVLPNEVVITDAMGNTVMTVNDDITKIDVSELPAGLYLLQFRSETGATSGRFVKE